jgi:hypothetical protein
MGNRRLAYELGEKILPLIVTGSQSDRQVKGGAAAPHKQVNLGREASASIPANLQGKNGHL